MDSGGHDARNGIKPIGDAGTCGVPGEIDLVIEHADGTEEIVRRVSPGGYFGELGPMLKLRRSASARAAADSELTGYGVAQFRALR